MKRKETLRALALFIPDLRSNVPPVSLKTGWVGAFIETEGVGKHENYSGTYLLLQSKRNHSGVKPMI